MLSLRILTSRSIRKKLLLLLLFIFMYCRWSHYRTRTGKYSNAKVTCRSRG